MNPWTILGWFLVVLVAVSAMSLTLIGLLVLGEKTVARLRCYRLYHRTRNVLPAEGQMWLGRDGYVLKVTNVFDNGVIGCSVGNASWGDSDEEWAERVRGRRLHLVRTGDS